MFGFNPHVNAMALHARMLQGHRMGFPHTPHTHFARAGYSELVGAALDELDAQDVHHSAGAYPAVGLAELVGAYPALGADPFSALMAAAGADPTAAQSALTALSDQMKLARSIDPSAVVVRDRSEDTRRVYHMGFDAGADTDAGVAGTATQQPQVTIRSERLIVPSFIAPFFTIDNIIVGKDSQSAVGNNPVPASTYSEVAVGVRLNLKTANLGHLVTIAFTNVDTDAHRFRATIIGTAVDVG
jgi:hypothetical protein